MKAVQFDSYGDPSVLKVADVPEPHAGPGQIRIQVKASGVNPIDWKIRRGFMSGGDPLAAPVIPGAEAAGYVDEVGEGVSGVAVGDEVFGLGSGTASEYAVLDFWAEKAPSIDWAVAASAAVGGETAYRALGLLGLRPGQTLFVDGGAGGVGAVAVQIAVADAIDVIASASEDNQGYLREIGATAVRYGDGVADRVREAAGAEVVDAVLDIAGKTPINELTSLVNDPAQVVTIANFDLGESGAQLTSSRDDGDPFAALRKTAELLQQNKIVIKIQTYPFDRAAEAHTISEAGHIRGKLVLLPA